MDFPKYVYRPVAGENDVDAVLVGSAEEQAALSGPHFDTPDEARAAFAAARAKPAAPAKGGK